MPRRGGVVLSNPLVTADERCDSMSTSVLNERLSELREAGIVELGPDGYQLTREDHALLRALQPLRRWARRWAWRAGV
jgi:DNA-binding HxlR family transcriptional regulator